MSNVEKSGKRRIEIAHSPDADDRFMFWPIMTGALTHPDFDFEFLEADTESLNKLALSQKPAVCAVSAIHYGKIAKTYQPLRMGCSVGENYGPVVVVTKNYFSKLKNTEHESLLRHVLSTSMLLSPGKNTTAHSVLSFVALDGPLKVFEEVSINPMRKVFDRLVELEVSGHNAAALLIHEGRLTYSDWDCVKIADIGELWFQKTGGSLPLGINVISRKLAYEDRKELSDFFIKSCHMAKARKDEFIDFMQKTKGIDVLSKENLNTYLDLYANDTTISVSEGDKKSFEMLLELAANSGLFESKIPPVVDWI